MGVASMRWGRCGRRRARRASLGSTAHQGICAEAGGYPYCSAEELLAGENPLVVALDQVQDPQNLGSICRTAECAGAAGVVIGERRAAEITPAVLTVTKTSAAARRDGDDVGECASAIDGEGPQAPLAGA